MEDVKVSVVMAVYNGEKYLLEQLDSIRKQTYQPDEVIICDDVSFDSSPQMIQKYIEKYKLQGRWKLHINKRNLGYADNFYQGMQNAEGQFIFLCDQDDIWLTDKIEKMIQVMEQNPGIQVLASEYEPYYFTEDAPRISSSVLRRMTNDDSLEFINLNYKNIFIGSEGCTMCVRRELLEYTKKYWYSGWPHDEYVWKMAQCLEGCYIYHHITLKRRLHSNNVSKRKMHELGKRISFLENLLASHKKMLEFAEEKELSTDKLNVIQRNITSVQKRIDLLQRRKIWNVPVLALGYFRCYQSKKSIPVELVMALKR